MLCIIIALGFNEESIIIALGFNEESIMQRKDIEDAYRVSIIQLEKYCKQQLNEIKNSKEFKTISMIDMEKYKAEQERLSKWSSALEVLNKIKLESKTLQQPLSVTTARQKQDYTDRAETAWNELLTAQKAADITIGMKKQKIYSDKVEILNAISTNAEKLVLNKSNKAPIEMKIHRPIKEVSVANYRQFIRSTPQVSHSYPPAKKPTR